jgi:uncharacterized repeat protein (TIGR03803 family)
LNRFALSLCAVAIMLVACGGPQPPVTAPDAVSQSIPSASQFDHGASSMTPEASSVLAKQLSEGLTQKYRIAFDFGQSPYGYDGAAPEAPLLDVSGTLYGTTSYGGAGGFKVSYGTVFTLTTTGKETVLYSFANTPDGARPAAGLVNLDGVLYGTTSQGGAYSEGCVFSISTSGSERVLHSFGNGDDGAQPLAGLTVIKGKLYGTTFMGGAYGRGTVFSINVNGKEHVLHSFGSGSDDGAYPQANLINLNGTLYGTTLEDTASRHYNGGAVFSITPAGKETTIYTFGTSYGGGLEPEAGLVWMRGFLYGTTKAGGAYGNGTVFAVSKAGGYEKVLHSFDDDGTDGIAPEAGLLVVGDKLYGTTSAGGKGSGGVLFSITTAGTERLLHSFGDGYLRDGGSPMADMIDINRTLYGTTYWGGVSQPSCPYSGSCDWGTVFALKL